MPVVAAEQKTQTLLMQRASRYLSKALQSLPQSVLEHALIAPNDATAVFEIVTRPETIENVISEDPLAEARMRGRLAVEKLLQKEGGCGTIRSAVEALGISKPAVEKRRRNGKLIAIDTGKRGVLYPHWQFKSDKFGVLDGLEEVLRVLREQGCIGWSLMSFFLNPHVDLHGKSPLQALRRGRIEEAMFVAENYGEMGR